MVQIDLRSREPIYEQIVNSFKSMVAKGVLMPDKKILSVREMARELSVNPNTVQKAYRALETEGYIYSVSGKGSFVCAVEDLNAKVKEEALLNLKKVLKESTNAGITREEMLELINEEVNYD